MNSRRHFLGLISRCFGIAAMAGGIRPAVAATASPVRRWERTGIPGVTYFNAKDCLLPIGITVHLNGIDVTSRATEADLEAGWIRAFHVEARDGERNQIIRNSEHYEFGDVVLARDGWIWRQSKSLLQRKLANA